MGCSNRRCGAWSPQRPVGRHPRLQEGSPGLRRRSGGRIRVLLRQRRLRPRFGRQSCLHGRGIKARPRLDRRQPQRHRAAPVQHVQLCRRQRDRREAGAQQLPDNRQRERQDQAKPRRQLWLERRPVRRRQCRRGRTDHGQRRRPVQTPRLRQGSGDGRR